MRPNIWICALLVLEFTSAIYGRGSVSQAQGQSKQASTPTRAPIAQTQNRTPPSSPQVPAASSGSPISATPINDCDSACQQARDNLALQRKLVILTGALVFVGVLQAGSMIWQGILMRKTRVDVHAQSAWMETQANHMNRQADIMQKQANEMQRQGELLKASIDIGRDNAEAARQGASAAVSQLQMIKDKERARLVVRPPAQFPRPTPFPVQDDDNGIELFPLELSVEIENEGGTKAFNVNMSGYITTTPMEAGSEPTFLGNDLRVQKVVAAFDAAHAVSVSIAPKELENFSWISSAEWQAVETGQNELRILGMLLYEDVFGIGHRTPFHFAWVQIRDEDGVTEARWADFSPEAT